MLSREPALRCAPGDVLARRFRIERFLGRGGMGEVYEAIDIDLRQRIALKLIRLESYSDPRMVSLLREEVRQARSVSHPNVCRVYDLERDEATGSLFIAMELLRGETLQSRLHRADHLTVSEALPLLRQIAAGIDAIHASQLLHLDLKPANVMLEPQASGDGFRVVVTDFGLAKSLAPGDPDDITRSAIDFKGGTPPYMSPERFVPGCALTSATDVYAFGLLAYEMLGGDVPTHGLRSLPPVTQTLIPELSPVWDRMIRRCIAVAPEDRFPSCGAALHDLDEQPGLLRVASSRAKPWRSPWGMAVAAAFVALAGALVLFWPDRPAASPAALKWYRRGVDAIREGTYYSAMRMLTMSVKESPKFPLGHASLAEAWLELDSPDRANEEMLQAEAPGTAGRLSSRDRDRIDAIHNTLARNFERALATYQRLADTARAEERPGALVDLGRALERSNQPRKAAEEYREAVRLDASDAGAWLRLAMVLEQLQQPQQVAEALAHAESLYQGMNDIEGLTEVYYQRGMYANQQSHLNEAEQALQKAQKEAAVTPNPHQQIRALYQLSAVAYQRGDTVDAEKHAQAAIDLARKSDVEYLAGRSYLDLGNSMMARGDFVKAREYFNEVLRIAAKYHNGWLEASALYSLGTEANRNRLDEEGNKQIERAQAWFQSNEYPVETSRCLLALAQYRRNRGDLKGAADAFDRLLKLAQSTHDDLQSVMALASLASVLQIEERYPDALRFASQEMDISQNRLRDGLRTPYAQALLAELYAQLGRFTESETEIQAAEDAAHGGQMEELLSNIEVVRAETTVLSGRVLNTAAVESSVRSWEGRFPEEAGQLLQMLAAAPSGASPAQRKSWCERALRLSQRSSAQQSAILLTEAEVLLDSRDARAALTLGEKESAKFRQEESEYSLFRTKLVTAMAHKQLGEHYTEDANEAVSALKRFQGRFNDSEWAGFQARSDFRHYENILRSLTRSKL